MSFEQLLDSATILAVDDNPEQLYALEQTLLQQSFKVICLNDSKKASKVAQEKLPDLIILDVNMPGLGGLELTRILRSDKILKYIPILLLTSNDSLEDLVVGFEAGADDYITKPFQPRELVARVRAALRSRLLYKALEVADNQNHELQRTLGQEIHYHNIIGRSRSIQEVFSILEKIRDSDAPVLITGESGTGKELVARAVHDNSPRRSEQFVVQNCSAFNDNLLESELFGHVRGAFTGAVRDKVGLFAVADGGTFFLDELGEMSLSLQAKLLRVLQEGTFMPVGATVEKKVNVRVVAATNRNLEQMMTEGKFREDLYYRINVINVALPPLRERRDDIQILINNFFDQQLKKGKIKTGKKLSQQALAILSAYNWPGNIRELQNEVERLTLMTGLRELIEVSDISSHIINTNRKQSIEGDPSNESNDLKAAIIDLEKEMIANALSKFAGNRSEVAKVLGISRTSLISKIKEYEIERDS